MKIDLQSGGGGRFGFTGGVCWVLGWLVLGIIGCESRVVAQCFPAPAGLVSFWPGDGNASDINGTNNGTLAGGATATALGKVGQAFNFDGTNGYVQVPDSAGLRPTNLTIEAWVNFASSNSTVQGGATQGDQYIVFKKNTSAGGNFEGYSLEKNRATNGDVFAFYVKTGSGQSASVRSTTPIVTNTWYHVAALRGSNFLQLYVNGSLVAQTSVSFQQDYATNSPLYFGSSGQSYDAKLSGQLDEVSLYNVALASTDIAAIYTAGSAGKCKAPSITSQPQSQTVGLGSNAIFSVTAVGLGSLSFQWEFNQGILQGQTNSTLILVNVTANQAGNYSVLVSNRLGTTVSSNTPLTVNAFSRVNYSQAYTFTTIAGQPTVGSGDGVGEHAQFNFPVGVAVDTNGNMYVTDTGNSTIRKITPAGIVTTIAGFPGSIGNADGTNSLARFSSPEGLAVGLDGNIYVADSGNNAIRQITPTGTNWAVTTIVASNNPLFVARDDSPFAYNPQGPQGVAINRSGNLYVTYVGGTINFGAIFEASLEISRSGTNFLTNWSLTTIASSANSSIQSPSDIAIDVMSNLYVSDLVGTIWKLSPPQSSASNWVVAGIAGEGTTNGNFTFNYSFDGFPTFAGIAVGTNGTVYAPDPGNDIVNAIYEIGTNWQLNSLAGLTGSNGTTDGTGNAARFSFPQGLATDQTGNIWVADSGNNLIRKVTSGGAVRTFVGAVPGSADGVGSDARFNGPTGITVDNEGNVFVTDAGNNTVRQITPAGEVITLAGMAGVQGSNDAVGTAAQFNNPQGITVDENGNLYIGDTGNHCVRRISPSGGVSTISDGFVTNYIGTNILDVNSFVYPRGLRIDPNGNIYVADIEYPGVGGIVKISPQMSNWVVAGDIDLYRPYDVALDSVSNIYVADYGNNAIVIFGANPADTNWIEVAEIGHFDFHNFVGSSIDGIGTDAQFSSPEGIAVDAATNIYVCDAFGPAIRKISLVGTNWIASTIGGLAGVRGNTDGSGNNSRFTTPSGIAVDRAGNLYIADRGNNTIRKGVFNQYGSAAPMTVTNLAITNQLQVTLLPAEANGQWRFPWESTWHSSGYTASNLAAGNYPVEFRSVPNWLAIPPNLTSTNPAVVTNGGLSQVTNYYYSTTPPSATSGGIGSLAVFLGANPPAGALWGFIGDGPPTLPSGYSTNLQAGTYLIDFAGPFTGRATPQSASVQVFAGKPTLISVTYPFAATPTGVLFPTPVGASNINTYPFAYNGQLQTDVGYGSGVAVQSNVVLTAAHLVFNDQTLAYANGAYWFLQEETPTYTPSPLIARGWYVLGGYATQRTNDLNSGNYSAGVSSPDARNEDVAALYFQSAVANGGYSGYLPSDAVPNTWLTGTANKMLVGYPVDGSLYGVTNITQGQMYEIPPQPYPLTLDSETVTNQQEVYLASWFLGYPGNSGGPLYVQLNGDYYPAGVYLGTLNGQSVVRGIDSNVTNLITLAATMGDNGTNQSGGGVITIIPDLTTSLSNPGYLIVQLGPPAALQAGAAWKLTNQPDSFYLSTNVSSQEITNTNAFGLQFASIPGWTAPTITNAAVAPGPPVTINAFYTVDQPFMTANSQSLGLSGTKGTTYRIEYRTNLANGSWIGLSTNLIQTNGFNPVLLHQALTNNLPTFYRAVWLGF